MLAVVTVRLIYGTVKYKDVSGDVDRCNKLFINLRKW
jgi:hypothetical protein